MSLARAFTTRRGRAGSELGDNKTPQRSGTHKGSAPRDLRKQISGPMELVHTTNMLSYNAPDISRASPSESTIPRSDTESETISNADSTPPTSPEAASSEGYPSAHQNHLSSYFIAPGKPTARELAPEVPAIPKRSPSHTKQNSYDALARQRSVSQQRTFSQMSRGSDRTVNSSQHSTTFSRSSSTSTRASTHSQASAPPTSKAPPMPRASPLSSPHMSQEQAAPPRFTQEAHPFGAELAQVTELAEEFASSRQPHVLDEDELYLETHGLMKLSLDVYMNDVQALFDVFYQQPPKRAPRAIQPPTPRHAATATAGPTWI